MNKIKMIGLIVGVVIGLMITLLLRGNFFANKDSGVATIEAQLKERAVFGNKGLPMMLDSETRLDTISTHEKTFTYSYTLVNAEAEDVTARVEEFKEILKPQMLNILCSVQDKDTKLFRSYPVTVIYAYYDKNAEPVTNIEFVPSQDCKE